MKGIRSCLIFANAGRMIAGPHNIAIGPKYNGHPALRSRENALSDCQIRSMAMPARTISHTPIAPDISGEITATKLNNPAHANIHNQRDMTVSFLTPSNCRPIRSASPKCARTSSRASSSVIFTSPLRYPASLSSRCPHNSSRVASSRLWLSAICPHNARILSIDDWLGDSRMARSRKSKDDSLKRIPLPRPFFQRRPAVRRETVIFAFAPLRRFLPLRPHQTLLLQFVQQRIDRALLPGKDSARLAIDLPDDFVPVTRPLPQCPQDQDRRRSPNQFLVSGSH